MKQKHNERKTNEGMTRTHKSVVRKCRLRPGERCRDRDRGRSIQIKA